MIPPLRGTALAIAGAVLAALMPAVDGHAATVRFDPRAFFSGRTEGTGTLKIIFRSPETVHVEGQGKIDADGTLELAQIVHEGTKPPRTRQWRLRETEPGRYSGTLTDAKGPVSADIVGEKLHIVFTSVDGYGYEQWLTLAADGRSARNILKVRKLGFTVANYDETIRKLD